MGVDARIHIDELHGMLIDAQDRAKTYNGFRGIFPSHDGESFDALTTEIICEAMQQLLHAGVREMTFVNADGQKIRSHLLGFHYDFTATKAEVSLISNERQFAIPLHEIVTFHAL